ncbi:MAG: chloride channel protein, partial [Clostridia bacterium]|nr:chloride channel protein [Clostridia bacterium]
MKPYIQQKIGWVAEYLRVMSKWAAVALITGVLGGTVGVLFHFSVDAANTVFNAYSWLIWLLPIGGLAIVWLYATADMLQSGGTDEIIDSIRSGHHIRFIMAPLIFTATTLTHLLGGSAGREGAALQLGGSIGVRAGRWLRFDQNERRVATLCGMSALFSALFCTPLTAAFFALEVISVGVMYYAALLPCLCSSLLAYALARTFGAEPVAFDIAMPSASWDMLWRTAILAVLCAGVSIVLCVSMREAHHLFVKAFKNPYWRIVVGGAAIILLTYISGSHDYNGSGMHIVKQAVEQGVASPTAWMWKLLFTAITIGCGFKGGEIVPTLFIGSTFGCVAGHLLGLDPGVGAAIGLIAVFCGATNCPVASLVLSVELFGSAALLPFALACAICYVLSGNFGLYHAQI